MVNEKLVGDFLAIRNENWNIVGKSSAINLQLGTVLHHPPFSGESLRMIHYFEPWVYLYQSSNGEELGE